MLSDPQSVTINAVAQTLPRTPQGTNYGVFTKEDGLVQLSVSHATRGKRTRHLLKLTHAKIAQDPLIASTNVKANVGVHIVMDVPDVGYTVAEQKQIVDALVAYAAASSGAVITKILGGES
jgi:hypothetical protein